MLPGSNFPKEAGNGSILWVKTRHSHNSIFYFMFTYPKRKGKLSESGHLMQGQVKVRAACISKREAGRMEL
jgi:hypothetical protein